MPTDDKPGDGAVTPSTANAGVTAEMQQAIQKVVMGIFKEAVPRLVKQAVTESVPSMLDQIAQEAIQAAPAKTTAAPNGGEQSQEKLSLKALQEQIAKLNQGIQERDRKVQEAEQRARDVRLRSEVSSHFAKHLGADSPHLSPYVNHFQGQFIDQDGQSYRKVKNEYGEEQLIPAAQAIEELFKGELKHLVQSSKASNLPRVQVPNALGQLLQPPQLPNGQSVNPILGEFARHFAQQGEIGLAGAVLSAQPSGEPKK